MDEVREGLGATGLLRVHLCVAFLAQFLELPKSRYERERKAEAREHEEKMLKEKERLRKLEELRKKRHAEVNAEQSRRAEAFSDFIHDLYGADEEADRFDDYLHNVKAEQFKEYCAGARQAAGVPPSG